MAGKKSKTVVSPPSNQPASPPNPTQPPVNPSTGAAQSTGASPPPTGASPTTPTGASPAPTGANPAGTAQPAAGTNLTRYAIWNLRQNKKQFPSIDALAKAMLNYIWSYEIGPSSNGLFIVVDDEVYLFEGIRKRLYHVDIKDQFFLSLLLTKYGLLPTEQITKHVVATLRSYSIAYGLVRDLRRFVHYNNRDQCLYISRYNGTSWRLDGYNIDIVPNGAGAVFADDDEGIGCDEPTIGPQGILQDALINDLQFVPETASGMTPDLQKLALTIWIYAIAFPELMPTKPMLILEGQKGSGKTSALQRILKVLHGNDMPRTVGKKDEDDFGVTLLKTPLLLLDNTDNFLEWLQDMLCTYATSGGWVRRKLFTDMGMITIRPQTFINIATKNPVTFKRDDVADRLIILRLEAREGRGGFMPLNRMLGQAMKDRPEIFGEWLWYLNEIVAEIRLGALDQTIKTTHRMADFAAMAHVIGKVLQVDPAKVDAMLNAMQAEREVLTMEGDPLIDLLDKWLEKGPNNGREITASDLHKELTDIAKNMNRTFYKSPGGLGQRLRDKALGRHFTISKRPGHGGAMMYSFRRAENDDTIVVGNDPDDDASPIAEA